MESNAPQESQEISKIPKKNYLTKYIRCVVYGFLNLVEIANIPARLSKSEREMLLNTEYF